MSCRYKFLLFLTVLTALLFFIPMGSAAQRLQEKVQPDLSGGFQLPSRDRAVGLPPTGRNQPAANNWRQFETQGSAKTDWTARMSEKGGDRSPLLRFKPPGEQGASSVLRRWPADAVVQGSSSGPRIEEGKEGMVGESPPAQRGPADLRGGHGAVLKGRPVAPDRP
jgi:hypothetical protein